MERAGQGGITGFAVIGALWILGGVGLGLYSLIGVVWLMRVRREAVPIDVADLLPATEQYHDALSALLERVEVRLTTRIMEPCIYGFFRPVILLPTWCLEENTPPNLEYILLHEGMHFRARDHWFLWLRRLTETVLWLHPAVWYAGQQAMAQAENVCDEAVVSLAQREGTPSAALMYSSCLMRVLERATRHAFEGIVPGVVPTAERIRRLVQQSGSFATGVSRWATAAVVVVGAVVLPGAFRGESSLATQAYHALSADEPPLREILYATRYPGDYFRNLYVMRSDGTRPMRLTDDRSFYMESCWSPDGSRIAAVTMREGTEAWTTWLHDSAGNVLVRLGDPSWSLRDPAWMPSGTALLAAGRAPTDSVQNIYLVDPNGPIIRRVTDDTVARQLASPSPDGSTLAIISKRPSRIGFELTLVDVEDGSVRVVPGAGERGVRKSHPAWSADGSRLAYLSVPDVLGNPDELRILDAKTLRTTAVGSVTQKGGARRRKLDWFPDDNALLVVTQGKNDTRQQTYRLDLDTGAMMKLTPGFEEAVMASVGPVASPDRAGGVLARAPFVLGPSLNPATGHTYYAVFTARRVTWQQANNAAKAMRHEGQPGYLACVTSEAESRFLLAEFPRTHHGFWLGGYGVAPHVAGAAYDWTWVSGEPWQYEAWYDRLPVTPEPGFPSAAMTWSLRVPYPEGARAEDYYTWHGQDPWQEELGFIVEFDGPAVSALR